MFFVPWNQPHFSADLNKIWHEASFHSEDGHGRCILPLVSLTIKLVYTYADSLSISEYVFTARGTI